MKNCRRNIYIVCATLVGIYTAASVVAGKKNAEENKVDNPYRDTDSCRNSGKGDVGIYEKTVKPVLDRVLSFGGLVLLSPLFVVVSAVVWMDDPGSVFFTQKRIGKDRIYFHCHKFRTMKMSAPHDVPTHQLEHPEQYITRVGRILRKTSLDELPQIWDIFRARMSVIGPRPALWNQNDLVEERDRYGVNDVLSGLTGWAQINGRDELEISDKAKLDGEYVAVLHKGGWAAFLQDLRCFMGTIASVIRHDGVIEGGTGACKGTKNLAGVHRQIMKTSTE